MPQTISMEPLSQMLKSIALQKRTGLLQIERLGERNAEQGAIYFEAGRPLRARAGQVSGRAALQRMSEWKQITCSFQGMSRPFPTYTRVLTPRSAVEVGEKPLKSPSSPVPQTDKIVQIDPPETEPLKRAMNQPLISANQSSARPGERVNLAKNKATTALTRDNQPLVLNGARLEAYTPEQSPRPSRAVQRWTTHLVPEMTATNMPPKPPVTPRLGPLPGEEVLPGRLAVFKARAMAATAAAIQRMERRERVVFILLDGRRTIQDIARLIHQTEADVEQILMNLAKGGYAQYLRG